MTHLALVFPRAQELRLPFSRDAALLTLAALNQLFTAIDIYLAHNISGGIKAAEWIPIIFGLVAFVLLLLAGLMARTRGDMASSLATFVFIGSVIVGVLGIWFHLQRTLFAAGSPFSWEAVDALTWAPPIMGPLFFVLISLLGISAAWTEAPVDSGILLLPGERRLELPLSKSSALFLITALFVLASLLSSVLDHARFAMDSAWVWLPLVGGLFAATASIGLALIRTPTAGDVTVYLTSMLLLIVIGIVGMALHAEANLTAAGGVVMERFLRGSPILAPLLFCNAGLLGLLVMMPPGMAETDLVSGRGD